MKPKYYIALGFVIIIALLIIYTGYESVLNNNNKAPNVVKTNTEIEDFKTETLNGDEYEFSNHKGILVIEVFAEWCLPCRKSVPEAIEFANANQDIEVLGLAFRDVNFKTLEFQEEYGEFKQTIVSNGGVEKALGVFSAPQTLFIVDGNVVYRSYGVTTSGDLEKVLALVKSEFSSSK